MQNLLYDQELNETLTKIRDLYYFLVASNARLFAQAWRNDIDRVDFIDRILNSSPILNGPYVFYLPNAVVSVVIPDHFTELENWQQMIYAVARATMDRDLHAAIDAAIALDDEAQRPASDKEDILFDGGWQKVCRPFQEDRWLSPNNHEKPMSFAQAWASTD
jgi:hypothetical protein